MDEQRIVEKIPDELVQRWSNSAAIVMRFVIGGLLAMWVPLAVALVWLPFRDQSGSLQVFVVILAALVVSVLWCAAVYALGGFVRSGWSRENLPVVDLFDDVLTLRWKQELIQAKVIECNLRIGRAWQMKYASRKKSALMPFGDRDLILIDFPPLYRDVFGSTRCYTTVAVGYTNESLRRWSAALGMNDVEPADAIESP